MVIMDNCAIHHEDIQHLIEVECGLFINLFICLLCLIKLQAQNLSICCHTPLTTTQLNRVFTVSKPGCNIMKLKLSEGWPWLIHQARLAVTDEMEIGWIENCGYSFSDEINEERNMYYKYFGPLSTVETMSL